MFFSIRIDSEDISFHCIYRFLQYFSLRFQERRGGEKEREGAGVRGERRGGEKKKDGPGVRRRERKGRMSRRTTPPRRMRRDV